MAEYIEREALLKVVKRMDGVGGISVLCREDVEEAINNAPAADVAPVAHGRWIGLGYDSQCSACGVYQSYYTGRTKYCPNCGARMDGETNG